MNRNGSVVYDGILTAHRAGRALFYLLIDPDKAEASRLPDLIRRAREAGVDGFLVGGSLAMLGNFREAVAILRGESDIPVVIFPGGIHQIVPEADAILFLSMISGRNPEHLIGQHVIAAPIVRAMGIEPISTGYMIVESGRTSTSEFMSYTKPLPADKPEIAAAHAMAAEMLGMKLAYLEAGSGADRSVPVSMIHIVSQSIGIPLVVGGGIRTPEDAAEKVRAGAGIVVVGNHFENRSNIRQLPGFCEAVHRARERTRVEV